MVGEKFYLKFYCNNCFAMSELDNFVHCIQNLPNIFVLNTQAKHQKDSLFLFKNVEILVRCSFKKNLFSFITTLEGFYLLNCLIKLMSIFCFMNSLTIPIAFNLSSTPNNLFSRHYLISAKLA